MEGIAGKLRELAYSVCTHESLEQERGAGQSFCSATGGRRHPDQRGDRLPGQHVGEGPSGRHRRFKKHGRQAIGRSRGGLTTKIHLVTASDRAPVRFSLSSGARHDSPEGMKLLQFTPRYRGKQFLLMDRAYGNKMRQTAILLGYEPVVPPKKNRSKPWHYDKQLYKRRNEVERFFRRIKRFRRVFTRYDKLDVVFSAFLLFAFIFDSLA